MYVRREIRALSPADTEAFLSSALSLWAISDEDGKARFGQDYHSVSLLLKYHHFNAGQQKTDHIHNGNGIIVYRKHSFFLFMLSYVVDNILHGVTHIYKYCHSIRNLVRTSMYVCMFVYVVICLYYQVWCCNT